MNDNMNMNQNHDHHHDHNVCGVCGDCHGMGGCHHRHWKFNLLRWILGFVIIWMIFSFGVKIGEIKSAFDGGWNTPYNMMRYDTGYNYGPSMMYYGQVPTRTVVTTPVVAPSK